MPQRALHLTRANGFGPLPEMFARLAGETALERSFERVGLPMAVIQAQDTPVPFHMMIGLFHHCGRHLGDRTLGLKVGEGMMGTGFGLWAAHALAAPTLGECIRRVNTTSWAHNNAIRLDLISEQPFKLWRVFFPHMAIERIHYSDHLLPPMLAACRIYLGPRWKPDWYEMPYAQDPEAWRIEERLETAVYYGQTAFGLALRPEDLLAERRPDAIKPLQIATLREIYADLVLAQAPEPARSLSAVVAMRLMDGKTDIEGAAEMARLSVQSLQRRLREKGYTYREVLERARMARAEQLLAQNDMPIVEVALLAGYEEHASFTRAFKRRFGTSPKDFRRSRRSA